MKKSDMKRELKDTMKDAEEVPAEYGNDAYMSVYLGSYMSLDPCGRYHHILSPNGATSKCERYWEMLDTCASELGAWIESGEGDPTDIYLCYSK